MAINKQIRVMKFGGTSVGNAECFRRSADILANSAKEQATVAVVSAMSGITNTILEAGARAACGHQAAGFQLADMLQCRHSSIAHALVSDENERRELQGEIKILASAAGRLCDELAGLASENARLSDALCSIGERLSARLLAAALTERGILAVAIDATALLVTSDDHGEAEPDLAATRARVRTTLRPLIGAGIVPVITGFIGATLEGIPTTLGRGGSDYSATIVAASLDAESVIIWTDVDGVMTADPKLVPGARTISEMSYREATTFAQAGAKVIHPKTLRPVASAGIPVQIRNTFTPDAEGTWVRGAHQNARYPILGIAARALETEGVVTLLTPHPRPPAGPEVRDTVAAALASAGIAYESAEGACTLSLTVAVSDLVRCVQILHDQFDLSSEREQNPGVVSKLREKAAAAFGGKDEIGRLTARRYNLALSPLT
ncbi:MAG: aspartate kinase [Acidobacteriota bacterium]